MIELLVVISIIGVLASVVLTSVNSARIKARDARRIADLNQIKTALEFYYDDNGYYPGVGDSGSCVTYPTWDCNGYAYSFIPAGWDRLANDLRLYLPRLPIDPLNSGDQPWSSGYTYAYGNPGRTSQRVQYDLTARLEDTNNPNRCGVRLYRFYFDNQPWCSATADNAPYNRQIYEASIN